VKVDPDRNRSMTKAFTRKASLYLIVKEQKPTVKSLKPIVPH